MLLYKHCDLLVVLSNALGKPSTIQRHAQTSNDILKNQHKQDLEKCSHTLGEDTMQVAQYLNGKLHTQAKKYSSHYNQNPDEYLTMDIDQLIDGVDETLMGFIQELTKPIRDSRRTLFGTGEVDMKRHRHFYALCLLLFNTNRMCNMPFHFGLTEAILCHGGSTELVRLFNKLGIVSSLDTNSRIATSIVERRFKQGIKPSLKSDMLSVVSIDNVDILQSHATVSSLDATRSWHGTSVQCIQPLPKTANLTQEEMVNSSVETTPTDISSDHTQSPIPVQRFKRRRRTLTEMCSPHTQMVFPTHEHTEDRYGAIMNEIQMNQLRCSPLTLSHFVQNSTENACMSQLKEDIHRAMLLKLFRNRNGTSITSVHMPTLPILIHGVRKQTSDSEVGNVVYVDVLSEKADCKATLKKVVGNLHKTFILELKQKWMFVIGDAKVYDLLQAIRLEYDHHLHWLIPLPGDWHILYNYQKVLMKAYGDAGLINLAKTAGYRAETLTSLIKATNFRRTHLFLLQAYEAFYSYFLSLFLSKSTDLEGATYADQIRNIIIGLIQKFGAINDMKSEDDFRTDVTTSLSQSSYQSMDTFMKELAKSQDTIKFWYNFITEDCYAYLSLFVSIRYRNWNLRTGSIKKVAAIFAAFDCPTYQRLIPQHLYDLSTLPDCLLRHLQEGAFAVRLSNSEQHAIALDECHEMCINKDSKQAIVRPNKDRMHFLSNYLPFRSTCLKNLKAQVLTDRPKYQLINHVTSRSRKSEENVKCMVQAITSHGMFTDADKNMGLYQLLENKEATPEQSYDLMCLRAIGQTAFESLVKSRYLHGSSTDAPIRRKRLCTFTESKANKQRVKQVEREQKLQQRILKRQLVWLAESGLKPENMDSLFGPVSAIPRALVDKQGLPYKSAKSATTPYLERRYKSVPVILTSLPWLPSSVILEGMFIIQTEPFPTMENMKEYVQMLFLKYAKPHFNAGVIQVHVIFDNPGALPETPKEIEQNRRDKQQGDLATVHTCLQFQHSQAIPDKWRALLSCRKCKHRLSGYVATTMLEYAPRFMTANQEFITNIKEVAYSTNHGNERLPRPCFYSNADEADSRVWLHCIHSSGTRKLIFSPDTDIYHIGLTIPRTDTCMSDVQIIVQLSKSYKDSPRFVDLSALCNAIERDPDLSDIQEDFRCQSLQSVYVSTGCDYISFFVGLGKASFLSAFFQYASFIASGDPQGSIGNINLNGSDLSFFSFVRLVGCTYFKSHTSAFKKATPVALFHSFSNPTSLWDHHSQWLAAISKNVWLRADSESKTVPNIEALQLHWRRSLWVLAMWQMATQNEIELPGEHCIHFYTYYGSLIL